MGKVTDSGRFVFNKDTPLNYLRTGQNNPSKPDNIKSETSNNESFEPDSLYTYSMGIAEIQASNNTYEDVNIYVSKPININENVLEVNLSTIEEHPVFNEVSGRASDRQTSVEYYISLNERPSVSDWIPILPEETKKVKGERLIFEGINATALFPFRMHTVILYEDGVKMDESKYYIMNTQQVQVDGVKKERIYTIDYEPNTFIEDPYTLQVNDYKYKVERLTEEFTKGTDSNKTISLKHVPYIDKEKLIQFDDYNPNTSEYNPIDVRITEASIRDGVGGTVNYVPPKKVEDGEPFMYNKTLYLDNSWSDLENFSVENGYLALDYYQYKNKLTFADHINIPMLEENELETPGTGTIRVSYDALVTEFRLKVILRRNTQKEITATPKVKEYNIKFKSAR